jgi:hypothetical protein
VDSPCSYSAKVVDGGVEYPPACTEAVAHAAANAGPFKLSVLRPAASHARGALQLKRPAPIPNECTSESAHSDPDGRSCNS